MAMNTPDQLATCEVVAHYRREGYAIIQGLLTDPELTRLREVFDGLETVPNLVDRFAKRLVVTRNLWHSNPNLKPMVWHVGRVAARLLGHSAVRLLDDVALVKPSRHEGGDPTIWHQDAPNFPFDRRGFMTVWIAVDDVSLDHGPLTFVPRSHRLGLLGAVDGGGEEVGIEALLRPEDYAYIGEPITTALSAGDASVHDGSILHSAGPNLTDRPRLAWGVRFIPPGTLYTGGAHRSFDKLGLKPFEPFDHPSFPLIEQN
jgi:ectoine hydroxylase-related dioxygenase (phytanoyl-CoA dioxygenase family)